MLRVFNAVHLTATARPFARGVAALALSAALAGCAGSTGPGETGWTRAPIADAKSVAGKWAGTLTRAQGPKDDWLTLTIRDDGSYEAVSDRVIGQFRGTGKLALADGKLVTQTEEGTAVVGLATRGTARRLDLVLRNKEGVETTSTLSPVR